MIMTRTPLRISFAGGGSDLASYYHDEPGAVLSTAIDQYIYIAVKDHFDPDLPHQLLEDGDCQYDRGD